MRCPRGDEGKEKVRMDKIHERLETGILLAIAGGFLDAYTYITRGGVFAYAQTGNMVLLSMRFTRGEWTQALYYFVPITAFTIGIIVTEYISRVCAAQRGDGWRRVVLGVDAAILLVIGLLPASVPNPVVTVTISFTSAMQYNSFRKVSGLPYATTMCTGNLRSAVDQLCRWWFDHDGQAGKNSFHYFCIIFYFCVGAALGTACTQWWGLRAVWACSLLMALILERLRRQSRMEDAQEQKRDPQKA